MVWTSIDLGEQSGITLTTMTKQVGDPALKNVVSGFSTSASGEKDKCRDHIRQIFKSYGFKELCTALHVICAVVLQYICLSYLLCMQMKIK